MLTRGWKRRFREAEADVLGCRHVVKVTDVEGRRCGVNGEEE